MSVSSGNRDWIEDWEDWGQALVGVNVCKKVIAEVFKIRVPNSVAAEVLFR